MAKKNTKTEVSGVNFYSSRLGYMVSHMCEEKFIKKGFKSKHIPYDIGSPESIEWMVDYLLEPRQYDEDWRVYNKRLKYLINLFFSHQYMSEEFREFIVAARQDKVYWRGDDFEFFRMVYDETMKMRENPAEYRIKARKLLLTT